MDLEAFLGSPYKPLEVMDSIENRADIDSNDDNTVDLLMNGFTFEFEIHKSNKTLM